MPFLCFSMKAFVCLIFHSFLLLQLLMFAPSLQWYCFCLICGFGNEKEHTHVLPHSLTLSLSLSLTHTHTHTHTRLSPGSLLCCRGIYTHINTHQAEPDSFAYEQRACSLSGWPTMTSSCQLDIWVVFKCNGNYCKHKQAAKQTFILLSEHVCSLKRIQDKLKISSASAVSLHNWQKNLFHWNLLSLFLRFRIDSQILKIAKHEAGKTRCTFNGSVKIHLVWNYDPKPLSAVCRIHAWLPCDTHVYCVSLFVLFVYFVLSCSA